MRLTALLALLLIGCAPAKPTQQPQDEPTALLAPDNDFDAGKQAVEGQRWQEAIGLFDKVLAGQPDKAEAVYYRALALDNMGKRDEAIAGYEKAAELDDQLLEPLLNLGAIYLEDPMQPEKALEVLKRAAKLDPGAGDVRENLAFALRLLKQNDKALEQYLEAIKLGDGPGVRMSLADLLLEMGKRDEATAHLDKATEGFAGNAGQLAAVAHLYGLAKSFAGCVKALDGAISAEPKSARHHVQRGVCHHGLKKEEDARADYARAIEIDARYQPAWYYTGLSHMKSDKKKAKEALQKTVDIDASSKLGQRAKKLLGKL